MTELFVRGTSERQPLQRLLTPARALCDLGVPPDDPLLASLVTDLVWNLRKMTMSQLLQVGREGGKLILGVVARVGFVVCREPRRI